MKIWLTLNHFGDFFFPSHLFFSLVPACPKLNRKKIPLVKPKTVRLCVLWVCGKDTECHPGRQQGQVLSALAGSAGWPGLSQGSSSGQLRAGTVGGLGSGL